MLDILVRITLRRRLDLGRGLGRALTILAYALLGVIVFGAFAAGLQTSLEALAADLVAAFSADGSALDAHLG